MPASAAGREGDPCRPSILQNRRVPISHVVGFDDAPFPRSARGDVPVVGCVFSETTFTGVLSGRVRKDGRNGTEVLARLVTSSKWAPQLQLVMLQGIALAGFNVVDLAALRRPPRCGGRVGRGEPGEGVREGKIRP